MSTKQLNPMCQIPPELLQRKHEASRLAVMLTAGCLTSDEEEQAAAMLRSIPELETARDVAVELAAQYAAERDQLRAELTAIKAQGVRVPDGYAGVVVWMGDRQALKVVTREEILNESHPGGALEFNAKHCARECFAATHTTSEGGGS